MSNIPAFPGSWEPTSEPGVSLAGIRTPSMGAPPEGGEMAIGRMLVGILRYKWMILLTGALGVGAGLVASRRVELEYLAQGTVWIQGQSGTDQAANRGPIVQSALFKSTAWIELLRSFTVLDLVVRDLQLYLETSLPDDRALFSTFALEPNLRPGLFRFQVTSDGSGYVLLTRDGVEVERGLKGQEVGRKRGFVWVPPAEAWQAGRVIEFSVNSPRDVAAGLGSRLQPMMAPDGRFLRLALPGSNPERIATTLNAVMERFVEVAAQLKRTNLDELTKILEQQKTYAEDNLRDAEMALQAFRVETITRPSGQGSPVAAGIALTADPVFSNYFEMKVDLDELRRDELALRNILAQTTAGTLTLDALFAVPAAQASPVLRQLLDELTTKRVELRGLQQRRYTDEHPQVQPLIAAVRKLETTTIPATVQQLLAQLEARGKAVEAQIGSASGELREIPPRKIEEGRLERRVDVATTLYGVLRQRYEEARLAAVSSLADVQILDPASVPFKPVKDIGKIVLAGFGFGSFGLAILIAFFLARQDPRVRYPDQITQGLGLSILGAVPRVKAQHVDLASDSSGQMNEAFRELRLSIEHAHGSAGPIAFAVTSPESGDGKSTTSAALAAVFAGQGRRVILIDGDIRRGALHRTLNIRRSPGLTDYLRGAAELAEILQPVPNRGFTTIGSGTRMQVGPELLGSPAMSHLLRTLRTQFEVIIVDTPPLGAGVDAYVIGTVVSNIVLVLRTGRTDAALAEAKLALLDRLPVRVLGAILNDIPPSKLYRSYTYLSGYEAEDEGTVVRSRQVSEV